MELAIGNAEGGCGWGLKSYDFPQEDAQVQNGETKSGGKQLLKVSCKRPLNIVCLYVCLYVCVISSRLAVKTCSWECGRHVAGFRQILWHRFEDTLSHFIFP